jgi:hypothetical protein
MTALTFRRRQFLIRIVGMAAGTFDGVLAHQGEESVFKAFAAYRPVLSPHVVAVEAVCAESQFPVIGLGGSLVFSTVATEAVTAHLFVPELRSRFMATVAVGRRMCPDQCETGLLVNLPVLGHQPGVGCMAAFTIPAQRLLMHIRMAGGAGSTSIAKFQIGVALPAIECPMLPCQWKCSLLVVEFDFFPLDRPTLCIVAKGAIHPESLTMRRLWKGLYSDRKKQ